ncbi:MAG: hypothetical protein ACNA8W_22710, partial [Bradymonadaceae bacterium]
MGDRSLMVIDTLTKQAEPGWPALAGTGFGTRWSPHFGPPTMPANLTAEVINGIMEISWTALPGEIHDYRLIIEPAARVA